MLTSEIWIYDREHNEHNNIMDSLIILYNTSLPLIYNNKTGFVRIVLLGTSLLSLKTWANIPPCEVMDLKYRSQREDDLF